jgi:hypothetical protein
MGNSSSYAPYLKMKGELEDAFKDLGFEHTVILKPGLLMGERNEVRTAEWATQKLFRGMGAIGLPMKSLMIEAHEWVSSLDSLVRNSVPPVGVEMGGKWLNNQGRRVYRLLYRQPTKGTAARARQQRHDCVCEKKARDAVASGAFDVGYGYRLRRPARCPEGAGQSGTLDVASRGM